MRSLRPCALPKRGDRPEDLPEVWPRFEMKDEDDCMTILLLFAAIMLAVVYGGVKLLDMWRAIP